MAAKSGGNVKKVFCGVILALFSTGCAKATLVDSNSVIRDGIEYYIQTDKAVYDLGENVEALYRITNLRNEVWHVTDLAPLRNIFILVENGGDFDEVWRWSWFHPHPPGPGALRLEPGESAEISDIWAQIHCQGTIDPTDDAPALPGTYTVSGLFRPTDVSVAVDISIVPEPSSLLLFVAGFAIVNHINRTRRN